MDEYPFLPVAEEVVERFREHLEADGWRIAAEPNVPGSVSVTLEHPLVPGTCSFGTSSRHSTAEGARRFWVSCLETHYQFDLVRNAPIRPERHHLVRRLRGIAKQRPSDEGGTCGEAITSVGYALFEEGILLRDEADWLAEAIHRDLQESERSSGP